MMSKYSPYSSSHFDVTFDALQMMPVDSSFRSFLQNLIISPMNLACRKGSPPDILILTIPASARSFRPRLASSMVTVFDEVSVWKQNPQPPRKSVEGGVKNKRIYSRTVVTFPMWEVID